VGDEDHGQAQPSLEITQQVDDLRLYRDIERRNWLIGDDQLWLYGKSPRDADPLPLTTGKLVRKPRKMIGTESDYLQQLHNALATRATTPCHPMDNQRLCYDLFDRHARIERPERVLKDRLRPPAESPQLAFRRAGDIVPIEENAAGRWVVETQYQIRNRALARAGLADKAEDFAGLHDEGDTVHGPDSPAPGKQTASDREISHQTIDFEECAHAAPKAISRQRAQRTA
jgi:hypothetical protein